MKFLCITQHVKRALGLAERFAGKNITFPILGNVLIEVEGNVLHATATNLEAAIQVTVQGSSTRAGRVCVPAKILSAFVQSIGDEKIQIEEKQGNLFIKSDTRDTRINGVGAEDFPLLPKIKRANSFSIAADLFRRGIECVLPAVAFSEFKPELGGVYINVAPTQLRLAATDTFRLAEKTIPLDMSDRKDSFSFILPYKIAQEVVRALDSEEKIIVSVGENQVVVEADGLMIISRLTEGNFPEYLGIIPKNFETSCFVNKDTFMSAVRASSIFTSQLQEVTMAVSSRSIEVKSLNQEVGEYKNIIPCAANGKDSVVGFNYRYFLDGLQIAHEDELFFGLNGEGAPSLIKNKSDGSFLYVLMPIRLS